MSDHLSPTVRVKYTGCPACDSGLFPEEFESDEEIEDFISRHNMDKFTNFQPQSVDLSAYRSPKMKGPEGELICPGCPACISGDLPEFKSDDEEEELFARHLPFQFKGYVGTIPKEYAMAVRYTSSALIQAAPTVGEPLCEGCPACLSGDLPVFEDDDEIDEFFAHHFPFQFKGYVGRVPIEYAWAVRYRPTPQTWAEAGYMEPHEFEASRRCTGCPACESGVPPKFESEDEMADFYARHRLAQFKGAYSRRSAAQKRADALNAKRRKSREVYGVMCPGCPACEAGEVPVFKDDEEMIEFFSHHTARQFKNAVKVHPVKD